VRVALVLDHTLVCIALIMLSDFFFLLTGKDALTVQKISEC